MAAKKQMEDESQQPRIFCWMGRCCRSSQEEQEDEALDIKDVEDRRRCDGQSSGQDKLVVEELRVEETCLRMSRSSSSLPYAEVWHF